MSDNRELLDRYVERYNAGDLDAVMDLYAEDAVQIMRDGTFEGWSAVRDRLAQELGGFTDLNHTVRSFVEQGDTSQTSGPSWGRTPVLSACRTAESCLPPGSGWKSRAWSLCGCAMGRSSSTPCTTTTWPPSPS
jgi:hypothetical protein